MKGLAGCRQCEVLTDVTSGTLGAQYIYAEVTNDGATDVMFTVINDFSTASGAPQSIPIKAGTTRDIPMLIYSFTASGPVTVVAYGQ